MKKSSHNRQHFTRGSGLLENSLSNCRARIADKLIDSKLREGRLLDLGCGSYPNFLLNTKFSKKYGVDKALPRDCALKESGLRLKK